MPRYAVLLRASANRVYGESAFDLAQAELAVLGDRAVGAGASIERATIAGVDYLVVDAPRPMDEATLPVLANLSGLHAAFELLDGGVLRPLPSAPRRVLDEDLVTIQRYAGKTNEAFTHLLVNLGLAAGVDALDRALAGQRVRLLDPVCGRGTTLNRAALLGMDAHGVELDQREVAAYETFLLTWLRDKRLKHKVERATLRRGRPTPAHRTTVTYGTSKDVATHRVLDVVHDDARRIRDHHKARSIDVLVADLPYGVQHGSTGETGRSRGPEGLLADALPGWVDVLRPGAGVALAWNRRTLPRPRLAALATEAGLSVASPEDERFVHRVDRSITRDVLVAARPLD